MKKTRGLRRGFRGDREKPYGLEAVGKGQAACGFSVV